MSFHSQSRICRRVRPAAGLPAALLLAALLSQAGGAWANSPPVVSSVVAVQREGSFLVDVTYDVADDDGDLLFVSLQFSPDGGATWPVACRAVTGDAGAGVVPGAGRHAVWDARADYPDRILGACTIRVLANDELPQPVFAAYYRSDPDGANEVAIASGDTIAFGEAFRLRWEAVAPGIAGLDPAAIAALDTVAPFDDGILGSKWYLADGTCLPDLEDCWFPRRFNDATGDSFSYFGPFFSLGFANDGSGPEPTARMLPSGVLHLGLNVLDINGLEVAPAGQDFELVINRDPQTILLDGESDWAHPSDPEIYPYYIDLDDPLQEHHPFASGDRIPDRTYVVFKALGRDDPRDLRLDPGQAPGFTGHFQGVRENTFGGSYSFASDASEVNFEPAWAALCDTCWAADTLGFLVGPSTTFTFSMQAVDEHGRRDGTPPSVDFTVGYPPCLQCIELLPKSYSVSAFPADVACADDPATHPCFQDVPEMRVTTNGVEPDALQFIQPVFMLVDKVSHAVEVSDSNSNQGGTKYVIDARKYRMSILLHSRDDERDAWQEAVRRSGGFAYQVDYDCDPFNQIKDGGGNDDILDPTWGEPGDGVGLDIDPASGLWRLGVDVVVPTLLVNNGPDGYLVVLTFIQAGGDPAIAQAIFDATTRQFGNGSVRAVAYDQTVCGVSPVRPARYNYFRGVRPSGLLPAGQTWRDCFLNLPDIKGSLNLNQGAMAGNGGVPVAKEFRIVIQTATGDYVCGGP